MRVRPACLALIILCLPLAPAAAEPVTLTVGGAAIRFSPPPGWCVYPKKTLRMVMDFYRRADQTNVPHIFYGDCKQIENNTQYHTPIHDFGYLATPAEFIQLDPGSREAFIATMSEALKAEDPDSGLTSLRDKINKADLGFTVGEITSLGYLDQDEYAVYSGLIQASQVGAVNLHQVGIWERPPSTVASSSITSMRTIQARIASSRR